MSIPYPPGSPWWKRRWGVALLFVGGVFLLVQLLNALGIEDDGGPSQEVIDMSAVLVCRDFVEDGLVSPATAQFSPTRDATVARTGEQYEVEGWVDSENRSGGNVRTDYTCTVEYRGDEQWRLVEIDAVGR